MQPQKQTRIGARVDEKSKRRYERLASKQKLSLSDLIRRLLDKEIEEQKKGVKP